MTTVNIQNTIVNINSIDYMEKDVKIYPEFSTPTPVLILQIKGKLKIFKFFGENKYEKLDNMYNKIYQLMKTDKE